MKKFLMMIMVASFIGCESSNYNTPTVSWNWLDYSNHAVAKYMAVVGDVNLLEEEVIDLGDNKIGVNRDFIETISLDQLKKIEINFDVGDGKGLWVKVERGDNISPTTTNFATTHGVTDADITDNVTVYVEDILEYNPDLVIGDEICKINIYDNQDRKDSDYVETFSVIL